MEIPPLAPRGPVGRTAEEVEGEAGAEEEELRECSKGGKGFGKGDRGTFCTLNGRPSAIAPLYVPHRHLISLLGRGRIERSEKRTLVYDMPFWLHRVSRK